MLQILVVEDAPALRARLVDHLSQPGRITTWFVPAAVALIAAGIMVLYENDFEHRADENFRSFVWVTSYDAGSGKTKTQLREVFPGGYRRLPGFAWFEETELKLYDARLRSRIPRRAPKDIVIVGFDQITGSKIRHWPISRKYHARLVDRLAAAGATTIAFDMRFDTPSADPNADHAFAEACARAGNVIVTADITDEHESSSEYGTIGGFEVVKSRLINGAYPELEKSVALGFSRKPRDLDSFVRRSYPMFTIGSSGSEPRYFASLSALAAGFHLARKKSQDQLSVEETYATEEAVIKELRRGQFAERQIPPIRYKQWPESRWHADSFLIDYIGLQNAIKNVSYHNIVSDEPQEIGSHPDALKSVFSGKIVFVGATWDLLRDIYATPYRPQGDYPGVEIQASAAHTLLSGDFLRFASRGWNVAGILAAAFGAAVAGSLAGLRSAEIANRLFYISRLPDPASPLFVRFVAVTLLGLALLAPIMAYWKLAFWLLAQRGIWITLVYPTCAYALAAAGVIVAQWSALALVTVRERSR